MAFVGAPSINQVDPVQTAAPITTVDASDPVLVTMTFVPAQELGGGSGDSAQTVGYAG